MRHTSWLNSLLSLNHLPPLPRAKKHMKLLSYLSMFLQNCLSFSTSTLFFDIFVQMENNTFESLLWHLKRKKKKKERKLLAAQNDPYVASIICHLFPQNGVEFVLTMLFFLPDHPLTCPHPSPSPTKPHAVTSLRAMLGAGCMLPSASNETLFLLIIRNSTFGWMPICSLCLLS